MITKIILAAGLMFCCAGFTGQTGATRIQAEKYDATNKAAAKPGDGETIVNKFDNGAWIKFNSIDFGKGAARITYRVASGATNVNAILEARLDGEKGPLLGTLRVEKNGWNKFSEQSIAITPTSGTHTVYIISAEGAVLLNWFEIE
jgi:hypothetical protein